MIDAGMKASAPGAEALELVPNPPIAGWRDPSGRPRQLPRLAEGHRLFAGFDQGRGEKLILIETLEDAQAVWDAYAGGGAIYSPTWYSAPILFAEDN
jgi:hypothetical protein